MEEVKKTGLTFIDTRRLANIAYKDIKNGFVGFGYYLKIIRDEKLWQGQGYDSFNEFLGDEYGKDKSWASRCINLYDKFGIPVEPGELPRLEGQYESYNVSQLIEMIPMQEELQEQVTPDMSVKAIRALKPKKEKKVATVATPEQEPEPRQEAQPEPEPEQSHPEKSGKCIHRPEFDCTLKEAHKLIPGPGEDCSRVCCWECVRRGDCELECYSSQRRPEHLEPPKTEPDCPLLEAADVQQGKTAIPSQEECVLDFYQHHMSKLCAQAANDGNVKLLRQELIINHGEPHDSGSTEYGFYQCGPERIHFQDNMCETFLSLTWSKYVKEVLSLLGSAEDEALEHEDDVPGMPESQDTVIDGEFTEIQNPEEPMTELQIAQDELERAKKLLNDGLKCDVDENDIYIRRLKLKVCALASYVCDLDDIVNLPPKPEQPELPVLKNNDQRSAFVDAYETWPLWIETKQTGERYYRYDLEDGTSMVVKVYHARIFDGYAPGSYEAQYHDGYGRHEYYLLRDGKFFRDCEANRGLLIEKLKEIQKVKKGCNQN
ncbi:hypothetical protein [Enterocloster bolteae]|jgi:hypothetical protein|uniref:hypothetical protein n=1 Tax=Enterocloster bolteae TaxID=208479 RepID=UPI0022E1D370|nr:hypothetical protein [Enterocloster bolteae]